jgi:hypothetical protein
MWVGSPLLLVMLTRLVGGARFIHHPIFWRSTTRCRCHDLSLLALLVGVDHIIRDNDVADKLWKGSSSAEHKELLQLHGEGVREVVLLLVRVNLLRRILC